MFHGFINFVVVWFCPYFSLFFGHELIVLVVTAKIGCKMIRVLNFHYLFRK